MYRVFCLERNNHIFLNKNEFSLLFSYCSLELSPARCAAVSPRRHIGPCPACITDELSASAALKLILSFHMPVLDPAFRDFLLLFGVYAFDRVAVSGIDLRGIPFPDSAMILAFRAGVEIFMQECVQKRTVWNIIFQ